MGVSASGALSAPDPAALSADAERAIKRSHAAAPTVLMPIDWTSAHAARRSLPLPIAARAKVDQARQPVLLPTIDGLTADASVTVGQGWHVVAFSNGGAHLQIQGSHRAHIRPALAAEQRAAGMGDLNASAPRVSQMHGIYTLSFERFGVSYSLDLECASHTDPRCADAAYLMTLFDSLVVVGGRP